MTTHTASASKSLFNTGDNRELIRRIQRLHVDSKPAWGKLDVSRMLAHCRQPLLVACGQLQLRSGLLGILFGKLAKRRLTSDKPWSRDMPTHPKFVIASPATLDEERRQLISLVERFAAEGPAVLSTQPHPFFGPLKTEEWDQLQWRHLDHHLRQFGV